MVWEGRHREVPPYPDQSPFGNISGHSEAQTPAVTPARAPLRMPGESTRWSFPSENCNVYVSPPRPGPETTRRYARDFPDALIIVPKRSVRATSRDGRRQPDADRPRRRPAVPPTPFGSCARIRTMAAPMRSAEVSMSLSAM